MGRDSAGLLVAQLKVGAAEGTLVSQAHHSCFLFGYTSPGAFYMTLFSLPLVFSGWDVGLCAIGRQRGQGPGEQPQ